MADLRTDYQDDVLDASENTARVYDLVDSNGNVVLAGVHLEDKTVYKTKGDDYGAADINEQNGKINELSADLSVIVTASQIGSGTNTFSIPSTRKRLTIITKKSNVIVGTKEIPTSVLESGDVVLLGNSAPIIGTDNVGPTGTLDNTFVGKQLYSIGVAAGQAETSRTMSVEDGIGIPKTKSIGLATDLSQSTGASITYNGSNSFTITVTDSTLSVYVY